MDQLFVDVESRAIRNLISEGVYKYWRDKKTETQILCYSFGDTDIKVWERGDSCPSDISTHIKKGREIIAHNAEFEFLSFFYDLHGRLGWPKPSINQFTCTAAMARCASVPGNLENAIRFLNVDQEKHKAGRALMLKLCKPKSFGDRGEPIWYQPTKAEWNDYITYCKGDVLMEMMLYQLLPKLTPTQQNTWLAAIEINQRGIGVDTEFVENVITCMSDIKQEHIDDLPSLTDGKIQTAQQVQKIKHWINANSDLNLDSIGKETLEDIDELSVSPKVWRVIQARLYGASAAVAKYKALATRQINNRVYGGYIPFGAEATGRFSSPGVQVHNMRRDVFTEERIRVLRAQIIDGQTDKVDIDTLGGAIRSVIVPKEGNLLVKADWAQIQMRIAPWLARDQHATAQTTLNVFAENRDLYTYTIAKMLRLPLDRINKKQRFLGKVASLSMLFQGGWRALFRMARANGLPILDYITPIRHGVGEIDPQLIQLYGNDAYSVHSFLLRVVDQWRDANPWAVGIWNRLFHFTQLALSNPGKPFYPVANIKFLFDERDLQITLPSGRINRLPFITRDNVGTQISFKVAARKPKLTDKEWPRAELYGGRILQRIDQAIEACMLHEALIKCYQLELPVVLTTHDEIVLEVPKEKADNYKAALTAVMSDYAWTQELPIAVDTQVMTRYFNKDD